MEKLPGELIEQIFRNLDVESLKICERVCLAWSDIIVSRFWFSTLLQVSREDEFLAKKFEACGWKPDSSADNYETTRKLYLQLSSDWFNTICIGSATSTTIELETQTSLEFSRNQICSFLIYNQKIFLGHVNGKIDSRSLPDFRLLNRLQNPTDEAPGHFLNICPLALQGNIFAYIDSIQQRIIFVNADTETRISDVDVPGAELRPLARVYNLAMNSYLVACLWRWSVVVWRIDHWSCVESDFRLGDAQILSDFESEPEFQNWLECHEIEVNDDYIVTHASRCKNQVPDAGQPMRPIMSYIQVRKVKKVRGCSLDIEPPWRIDAKVSTSDYSEIQNVRLSASPANRLAIFQVAPSDVEPVSLQAVLDVVDLTTRSKIFSLPTFGSIFFHFQVPVHWFDEKLIVKEWHEDSIVLSVWDVPKRKKIVQDEIRLKSASDLLQVKNFRLVHIFNKFPVNELALDTDDDPLPEVEDNGPIYRSFGVFYDFWNSS